MASALASAQLAELPYRLVRVPKIRSRPRRCALVLASSDALALFASVGVGYLATLLAGNALTAELSLRLWPCLFVFPIVFASVGLYPGVISNPVKELQKLVLGVCLSFTMFAALVLMDLRANRYPIYFFLLAWAAALLLVPGFRNGTRFIFARKDWWGVPTAVLYTGDESARLLKLLRNDKRSGITVAAVLAAPEVPHDYTEAPVVDLRHAAILREAGISHALLAMSDSSAATLPEMVESLENLFPKLLFMSDVLSNCSLNTTVYDLHGSLAVEVCRNLLRPVPTLLKRISDFTLLLCLIPFTFPLILFLGFLVKLESPGGMFYCHRRIGKNNRCIQVWKIRTMYKDSEGILQRAFAEYPALRAEWLNARKLCRDPRVTRIGRFIRRASLDELPQLWNVLTGEMSFVGPRPIVADEAAIYGDRFPLYCRVAPGITGLWQVSGRNDMSLGDRVRLDCYYVKNWSPWLDCHILLRTIGAVFTGKGAY
jgi:Undecaprenyl-phosphate galactose phosphotransferase WbaP